MASRPPDESKAGGSKAAADTSRPEGGSTATSAATADPEKQQEIRAEREKILAAQEKIRRLTSGRASRAGSDVVALGAATATLTKTVTEDITLQAKPTIVIDPVSGGYRQIPPPSPLKGTVPAGIASGLRTGSATGETTDTASGSRTGLSAVELLTPAHEGEALAVQCIIQDNQGRRIRIRTPVSDEQPNIGEVISIGNVYGPGQHFRGKVMEVSDPMIVDKTRITNVQRTERSKAKLAARQKEEMEVPDPPEADETGVLVIDISDENPADKPETRETADTGAAGADKADTGRGETGETGETPAEAGATGETGQTTGETPADAGATGETDETGADKDGETPAEAGETGETGETGADKDAETPADAGETGETPADKSDTSRGKSGSEADEAEHGDTRGEKSKKLEISKDFDDPDNEGKSTALH